MREKLRAKLADLPDKPGIYFFKNSRREIIYIGKARSLKDRVRSYFLPTDDLKVSQIISETKDLDFILTGSEKEAAFLENNFVQRYQPKFNLRLKDDKSFPYLKLTTAERYPGVYLTRKVEDDGAGYFGPFSPALQARKTIHLLNRYFGIRGCAESIPGKRRRPCLEYDLKLCSAPCVGFIGESDYGEIVANGRLFLEGRAKQLLRILKEKMTEASRRQEYEQAAHWRDLIRTIEQVREKPRLTSVALEDVDILGLARAADHVAVYVLFMRKGKVREAEEIVRRESVDKPVDALLTQVLEDFYRDSKDLPAKILLPGSPASLADFAARLSSRKGKTVKIQIPQKGQDRRLVDLANQNAAVLLRKSREDVPAQRELAVLLGLKSPPERIEGFDISNTGGDESVGSLVVFEGGKPNKDEYRKYKIKGVAGPNDIASLKEVVRRRYARVLAEGRVLPDLILVDGGKGQLQAAETALRELGLTGLAVVSLAKKEEIVFTRKAKSGLCIDRTSPALKLLQRIRDEAHRFAVSFHRRRREKKSFASALDGIPGLGPKRRTSLLARYRSLEEIERASEKELAVIIGPRIARILKEEGHDRRHRD
ncbi:MAG: excinuclease ABC subunit UvrC [Candidatus Aminicenantes bacterium]|nr:excinuclease ABC subunit UvrC [Candidatus Aminicenantes bacterium]